MFQIEKNDLLINVRGEPKTAGGLVAHISGSVTKTVVELTAEPFSATQLRVNVTVCGVFGMLTLMAPAARGEDPLHPLTATLLERVQFKLPVKSDAVQLTVEDVPTCAGLPALKVTDGLGPVVCMAVAALSGSMATALSTALVISCVGCKEPLTLQPAPLGVTVGQLLLMVNWVVCAWLCP